MHRGRLVHGIKGRQPRAGCEAVNGSCTTVLLFTLCMNHTLNVYIIRFRCLRPGDADVALLWVLKTYIFGIYVTDCEVSRLVLCYLRAKRLSPAPVFFLRLRLRLFAACPTCLSGTSWISGSRCISPCNTTLSHRQYSLHYIHFVICLKITII